MNVERLAKFIRERHAIWVRRFESKLPKPWTHDPILRQYRFCNVYRELDTVTQWIDKNMREPLKDNPDIWFAMVVARLINWPDTLEELKPFLPWKPDKFVKVLEARAAKGEKVFTGAYMIHAGDAGVSKASYLAAKVLNPMWNKRLLLRPKSGETLKSYHARLREEKDMGDFMAAQIVCDLKYVTPLKRASDRRSFAAPGPGSMRGLARVMGYDKAYKWRRAEWEAQLAILHDKIKVIELLEGLPFIDAQDLQNCLCEFDKYERVRLGEGRPRAKYDGGPNG